MIRALALLFFAPAPAGAFDLAFPADCTLGESCFIQQYPDHDPGPGAQDFTCGPLSYDGHDGTDIAVPSLTAMQAGVAVRAAAEGTVKGLRDGMPDIAVSDPAAPSVQNRECGNGVVIDHGGGWETQYCHLRQGSVAIRQGARVPAGAVLGLIGMSGQADFPHVHLSLRRNGREIDPFAPAGNCGAEESPGLWAVPVPYAPGGIIAAGFADAIPEYRALGEGLPPPRLTTAAPALVLWAYLFGGRAADRVALRITGPAGEVIAQEVVLEKTQARLFRAVGKRRGAGGWPEGRYEGEATLLRAGQTVDQTTVTITLAP